MIGNTFQFAWEVSLIEWCQTNIPTPIIKILEYSSYVGDTVVIVGIVAFFYLCFDKELGKKITLNAVFSLLFNGQIKNIFLRRRPYFDNENIECLKIVESGYDIYDIRKQGFSFPSMHSSNIVIIAGSLYSKYKTKIIFVLGVICSLIVSVSRFVLGCHYPTDVIVGLLVGIFTVLYFDKFKEKLGKKKFYIVMIIYGLIGFFWCTSADYFNAYGILLGFIASNIVDDKYFNFKNTRNIKKMIVRLVLAFGIFLLVSEGLKLPFPEEILEADTLFAYAYRSFRYALALFLGMGLTPGLYKYNFLKLDDKIK